MRKRALWILLAVVAILAVVFFCLWQAERGDDSQISRLCQSSASEAYYAFRDYRTEGDERDYWSGVAAFRTFMQAYLMLNDGSDAEYLDCSELYAHMLLDMPSVCGHIEALIDAMAILGQDYTDPNGYLRITALKNELIR